MMSATTSQTLRTSASAGECNSIHEMLKNSNSNDSNSTAIVTPTTHSHPNHSVSYNTGLNQLTTASNLPTNSALKRSDSTTLIKPGSSRIETIKNWSISTYKCTKQLMFEKLGRTSRTIDSELETEIEQLRDTQQKYMNILQHSRALTSHFYHLVQTQQALGDAFSELAQKSPELQEEFLYNSETQRNLTKNGETLLGALNFFISSVSTLCNKTIEDTLQTIRQYELARIKYDAYRTDYELLKQLNASGVEEAHHDFNLHKEQYERLRTDVSIKLKFLDENRIKVMHKQLLLFHNAVSAYFSGNQTALETTLKQFNIKMKTPNSTFPSWLEQQ